MISDVFLNKRMRFLVWITVILCLAQATRRDLNDRDYKLPQTTTVAKAYVDIECHAEKSYNFMFVKVDTTESITIAECEPQPEIKVCHLMHPTKDNLTYSIHEIAQGCWSLRVHTISEDVYGRYQCITSGNITPRGATTTAPQSTGATTTNAVCSQENHGGNYYPILVVLVVIGVVLVVIGVFIAIVVSLPYLRAFCTKIRSQGQYKTGEERPLVGRGEHQSNKSEDSGLQNMNMISEDEMATLPKIPIDKVMRWVEVSGDSDVTHPIVPVPSTTVQVEQNVLN